MANEENLRPLNTRTKSEQRAIQRKGGQKSGEVRRKKKALKECMLQLLDMPVTDTRKWNKMSKLGFDADDIDNRTLLAASLFAKAVQDGDVAAFKEIRNLIGEDNANDNNGKLEELIRGLQDEDV